MNRVFCKRGNAYVIPNPYNCYAETPEKCIYKKDRIPSACDRCVMYVNSQQRTK